MNEEFWRDKSVLVTGASGFVGSHLLRALTGRTHILLPSIGSRRFDLRSEDEVKRMFDSALLHGRGIDMLFHLAATVGGIGANRDRPADFYYDNAMMNALIVKYSTLANVGKLVCLGSVCAYPKFTPVPFREENLWDGYPEETNAPYGVAKRALLVHLQAARAQYGLRSVYLLPTNLYGPGDSFDPQTSHVIPALIRKFVTATTKGIGEIVVWGTGRASRDFVYIGDAVRAIILAAEHCEEPAPLNLGSGQETTIAYLVEALKEVTDFSGVITWDATKPDGQPRRALTRNRIMSALGWKPEVSLHEGLARTVEWYKANAR